MLSDFSKPLHRWPTSPGEFLIGGKIVEGIIDAEVKIDALDSHKIEAPTPKGGFFMPFLRKI